MGRFCKFVASFLLPYGLHIHSDRPGIPDAMIQTPVEVVWYRLLTAVLSVACSRLRTSACVRDRRIYGWLSFLDFLVNVFKMYAETGALLAVTAHQRTLHQRTVQHASSAYSAARAHSQGGYRSLKCCYVPD